ncbi:MAG TPA: hypothetical protein DEB06_02390 [Phycisphaerales bacterium]|nr:hypothetical protein [Phycisphaerales bacterium]
MLSFNRNNSAATDRSFLPEDYLERRVERRTNLFSLTLFAVVMAGVVGAFLVTHRQWNDVRRYQEAINVRYSQAAKEIEQLKTLEKQKNELLEKAEVTTALIERVPRSILLADIINRMPTDVTMLDFELKSKRGTKVVSRAQAADKAAPTKNNVAARTAPNAKGAKGAPTPKPEAVAPSFETRLTLIGVTKTHENVARFGAALQQSGLLSQVELIFSEKTQIQNQEMNRFRFEANLRKDADARKIEPMTASRQGEGESGAKDEPRTAEAGADEGGR